MRDIQKSNLLKDKIKGAIYGFAIGDAFGATTEFMTKEQIQKEYGTLKEIVGGGWLNLKAGDVTDDTQMSICVMKALMKDDNYNDLEKFRKSCIDNFIDWYKSDPIDIGGQCSRGIENLIKYNFNKVNDESLGNGSLMRAMPCAVAGNIYKNISQSTLTHNNIICAEVVVEYSNLLEKYLDGKIYGQEIKSLKTPSGFILNTFNNSRYWAQKDSFEEALIGAVNDGGDADTIGAITGSLSGAKFGYKNIPDRWLRKLNGKVKDDLEEFNEFIIRKKFK